MQPLEQQFAALYEQYYYFIFCYIHKRVFCLEDAEDMAQEVFTRAYAAFSGSLGSTESGLRSWLFKIAANIVCDYFRRRRKIVFVDIASLEHGLYAPDMFDVIMDRDEIRHLLSTIKPQRRTTFYLRAYDYPFAEIGEALGSNASSVKNNYVRDLGKLAELVS